MNTQIINQKRKKISNKIFVYNLWASLLVHIPAFSSVISLELHQILKLCLSYYKTLLLVAASLVFCNVSIELISILTN